jgi:hypothetical protein
LNRPILKKIDFLLEGDGDMLNEILKIGGGIIVGIVVGYCLKLYQDYRDSIKEDKNQLIRAHDIILEIERFWKTGTPARSSAECMDELSTLSYKIQREDNKDIKIEIRDFSERNRLVNLLGPERKRFRDELKALKSNIRKKLSSNNGIEEDHGNL